MNPSITVPVVVCVVISTACTHHLPAGCHPSITEDITLTAGQPVSLSAEQAAFAFTLPGVVAAGGLAQDTPPVLLGELPIEANETPAAAPPPFKEL